MPTSKSIAAGFILLALVWVGIGIYMYIDFERLFDQPEDVIVHFQQALTDFDFDRAWEKLSLRLQRETYRDKKNFTMQMYSQFRVRRDIAQAQVQQIDALAEDRVKAVLRNWYLNDFVVIIVVQEQNGAWKIDSVRTNIVL